MPSNLLQNYEKVKEEILEAIPWCSKVWCVKWDTGMANTVHSWLEWRVRGACGTGRAVPRGG